MLPISIVICTWNRVGPLRETLAALEQQRVPEGLDWQVLVVDNGSADGTASEVRGWFGRLPIALVIEETLGLSHARNRGLRETTREILSFLDDDASPLPGWLAALAPLGGTVPAAGVFGGPVRPRFEVPPPPDLTAVFPLLSKGFSGVDRPGLPDGFLEPSELIVGANMAFRRKAIEGLWFDPDLGRVGGKLAGEEDFHFIRAVESRGWRRYWSGAMAVEHLLPASRMTLSYLRRYTMDTAAQGAELFARQSGPSLGGAPRWLVLRCGAQYLQSLFCLVSGRHHARLIALREHWRLLGLIKGVRQHRRSGAT